MIHGSISDLIRLLEVQSAAPDTFSGRHLSAERSRVYGGQFLGQGLMAALADTGQTARSLQCLYLRPGSAATPLVYSVAKPADGLREVQTHQNGKCLFTMVVRCGEPAGPPNVPMPAMPPPEQCVSREEGAKGLNSNTDSTWAVLDSPFDYRFVENIWADDYRSPGHNVWFRAHNTTPAQRAQPQHVHQAVLAYFSDDTIMDNGLFPHGWQHCWSNLQTASLDHSLWFHQPVDIGEWLLFAQDSPVAAHGRGTTRGLFYTQDGNLVASAYQEILMR